MPSIYEEILDRLKKLEKRVQNPFCCFPGDTGDVLTITDGATGTVAFEPSGGGGGNTIYTGDGTLVGDRLVDGGGNSLFMQNMSIINLQSSSGTVTTILNLEASDLSTSWYYTNTGTNVSNSFRMNDSNVSMSADNTLTGDSATIAVDTAGDVYIQPLNYASHSNGEVFTLIDATTGQGDWQPASGGGSRISQTITTDTSVNFTDGQIIDYIWVDPSAEVDGFQVGITPTGDEIVPTQDLTLSNYNFFTGYRSVGSTTLYFQNVTSSIDVTFIMHS